MIISCNLFFICDVYFYSTLLSTINCHLFLPRRILHAEVMQHELSFTHKMSLQTVIPSMNVRLSSTGDSRKVKRKHTVLKGQILCTVDVVKCRRVPLSQQLWVSSAG